MPATVEFVGDGPTIQSRALFKIDTVTGQTWFYSSGKIKGKISRRMDCDRPIGKYCRPGLNRQGPIEKIGPGRRFKRASMLQTSPRPSKVTGDGHFLLSSIMQRLPP
jgi:hypothetical protein